jgi:alkylated DNA repair protein (DNA oxidative demethylase)
MTIELRPGAILWRARLSRDEQEALIAEIMERIAFAPFYRTSMPRTGKPLSAEMTNFGELGWFSDVKGYRYEDRHPVTRERWPSIPAFLLRLWDSLSCYPAPPEACLVNLYRGSARMGLHQDRNEEAIDAPVLSVSLGDDAIYRIGGVGPREPTSSVKLNSGDVLVMGGQGKVLPSRHRSHPRRFQPHRSRWRPHQSYPETGNDSGSAGLTAAIQ